VDISVQYLPQNPPEKSVKFKVFTVKKCSTLTDFMSDNEISPNEMDRIFYELLPEDEGLSLVHYVEVATIDKSKVAITINFIVYMHDIAWCMQYIATDFSVILSLLVAIIIFDNLFFSNWTKEVSYRWILEFITFIPF
jgi:hypothetical protein